MESSVVPVITVPATNEATAALTDWLIRELVPTVLEGVSLDQSAGGLRDLPAITAHHIVRPRKLRVHVRYLRRVVDTAERHLRRNGDGAVQYSMTGNGVDRVRPVQDVLPDQVMDAAARVGGDVAELGSMAAALANRVLLLAGAIVGSGGGMMSPDSIYSAATESYCSVLASLWHTDPNARVELKVVW
ncbi:hypothetical protein SIM91_00690 [Rhodococcus opacus]|uniref:hypothetical protein n=1 Tax=Rhodococcus TaxID=1827 RepID=UPI0013203910|nr:MULTISPECIES: hypothetical protein [Rhodococcus]MDX5961881.1 hypothetical protein [Rhodococcus opacus]QHE74326.1 hypothetical protein GFS60_08024 [Rhodococcus sp. WAY2]